MSDQITGTDYDGQWLRAVGFHWRESHRDYYIRHVADWSDVSVAILRTGRTWISNDGAMVMPTPPTKARLLALLTGLGIPHTDPDQL